MHAVMLHGLYAINGKTMNLDDLNNKMYLALNQTKLSLDLEKKKKY